MVKMRGRAMRKSSVLWGPAVALALSACAQDPHHLTTHYLDQFATLNPTVAHFTVCHGFFCVQKTPVSLNEEQWRRVAAIFKPRAKDARQERQQIARAVALVESIVGPQAGIAARQWTHKYMLVLPNLGDLSQIDCVDASVNTWTYMTLMEGAGLFQFHKGRRFPMPAPSPTPTCATPLSCRKTAAAISRSTQVSFLITACRRLSCRSRSGWVSGRPIPPRSACCAVGAS